jgi:2-polyprenyl-6-methoxyphenol hydroxylase-like FAD-dependent oxidoreductase
MGLACVYGHLPTNLVSWLSEQLDKSCTMQDVPGSLFMIPEVKDGSDLMVGRQFSHPALGRAGWDALAADSDQLYNLFSKDYEQWNAPARLIMDQLSLRKRGLLLWPFSRMPKLAEWASATGRTIIIGDAAHAMPPSSGQGVNQAFEDAYTLTLLLPSLPPRANLNEALSFWRNLRQARIDAILRMAAETDASRLPEAERRDHGRGQRRLDQRESHAS